MKPILPKQNFWKVLLLSLCFVISIGAFAQPANNNCNNATVIASNLTCVNTAGTINAATASTGMPTGCASGGTHYDVWFRFTALGSTHTITISSLQANFTNPEIQLYTGSNCNNMTSVACGTTSITSTTLSGGNTYFIRVSNVGASVATNGNFNICITHPPGSDECAGAINLVSGTSCNNSTQTLNGVTASASIPVGCAPAGALSDRWFSFTAVKSTHTVTISNRGSNFSNPGVQLFSGTCGALNSLFCGTTTLTATGLTVGNVYYVRVFRTGGNITTNGEFDICVTHPNSAANDDCSTATLLTSNNTCNTTTGNLRYATSNGPAGACAGTLTTTYDVWYKFVANSTMHAVRLSNLGSNLSAATTYIETLSGTCGALTSLSCQTAATRDTIGGLTIGNTYYVRVFVTTNPTASATSDWNFNICIQNPPPNDDCGGAVTLTPGATCTNVTGRIDLATTGTVPVGCFGVGTYWDVWYKFTASAVAQTVTLSNVDAIFTAPRMQIYSGTCPGGLVSMSCATGLTITQAGLTIGNVYYIRVANNANPWTTTGNDRFDICVTTAASPPANDNCNTPSTLNSGLVCNPVGGTLIRATASVPQPAGACGLGTAPDVWYSFVAQSGFPQIQLSAIGANMQTNGRMQLLTGAACGSLTAVGACWSFPAAAAGTYTPAAPGLITGQTYYIRITHSTLAAPTTIGTYTWNICIVDPDPGTGATVNFGKGYVNLNDIVAGGTNHPGDTLEMRATIVIERSLIGTLTRTIDSLAYYDTLRAGSGFRYVPNSLALKTNEGKLFRPTNLTYYTDLGSDADAGWITYGAPGSDTALQINMGTGSSRTARGNMASNSRPSFYSNTCIVMATYRVVINGGYGSVISFGGGTFRYRDQTTGTYYTYTFPNDSLMVYDSPLSCPNNLSATNVVGDENGGTFGAATGAQNRAASPNVDFTYTAILSNQPNDNFYSVVNNTAANGSTSQTVAKPSAAGVRVHNVFDISGDHSGAANQAKGNLPCNNALPISATNPCGYALLINAAYNPVKAFSFTVTGACTETYYEISAWFKNMCYKCGCDSAGRGPSTAGYIPTELLGSRNDSAGVRPNIAVEINGVDYYTTGDLRYQGLMGTQTGSDTLNNWVRRSFVYKTLPGQTSFTMDFRNNAPGGGGNDWAIDDIKIRTCYPNMIYSPSSSPSVCAGQTITIRDTVRSYYNVYIYYKWQRSTNGGVTWIDLPGASGVASTVWNGSAYEYVNAYTIPPAYTTPANSGDLYRMQVATSGPNLASGSCSYSDSTVLTLNILTTCKDIDDDNDGIPDYVELNNPVALQDANGNGNPNWSDPTYVPYMDVNGDGFNDYFDPGADIDGDGLSNYADPSYPGFVDINLDGINDNMDKDLDGIPNFLDLDSDNDGIPDVVESYGVDTDGNGIIDNYTDTDADGFSQNVDNNNTGVLGSGNGLGAQDFDGDGVPNYLDTDSDNDGIPDAVEVAGLDADNDGKLDNYIDGNADGLSDNNVNGSALLITGPDLVAPFGRADNWPNKNLDRDLRPNAYDLDSDGDGIVDVLEAGLPDVNLNGLADGALGSNGWSTTVSGLAALNLRNTDGSGNPDYLDIDSDNDGIPDNIEGQSTASYKLPTLTDADGDGLMSPYDNLPAAFSGSGIFIYDHDGDGTPDYRDLDTDGDGQPDIVEGNDFNLNKMPDDNVTLTGLDTDGDGLDDRFDSLASVTSLKGTSYMMGTNGSFTGDAAPGARCPVSRSFPSQTDRDWRYVGQVLPVEFLKFAGQLQNNKVPLNWTVLATKEIDHFEIERSLNNVSYTKVGIVSDPVHLFQEQNFNFIDDVTGINNEIIYYRLKVVGKTGEVKYSNILVIRKKELQTPVTLMPNPASNYVTVNFFAEKNMQVTIILIDKIGSKLLVQKHNLTRGFNNISLALDKYNEGVYALVVETGSEKITKQLVIVR